MKIIEKMAEKSRGNWGQRGVVIGFLGDSVTQGCFELNDAMGGWDGLEGYKKGVKICDCYGKWKKLAMGGVNITELLANQINHPTREMNWLFAVSLVETMFEN